MKQVALIMTVVLAVLLVGVALVYAFGTPQQAPQVAQPAQPVPDSASAGMADAGAPADPNAEAPPPDPDSPLAIEIPGCVCHSDDPAVVERHAEYRMNQCAGCHMGGVPTGQ